MNGCPLTKTEFIRGLDCVRRAWLDRNRTEDEPIQGTRLAARRHAVTTTSVVRKSYSTEYQSIEPKCAVFGVMLTSMIALFGVSDTYLAETAVCLGKNGKCYGLTTGLNAWMKSRLAATPSRFLMIRFSSSRRRRSR